MKEEEPPPAATWQDINLYDVLIRNPELGWIVFVVFFCGLFSCCYWFFLFASLLEEDDEDWVTTNYHAWHKNYFWNWKKILLFLALMWPSFVSSQFCIISIVLFIVTMKHCRTMKIHVTVHRIVKFHVVRASFHFLTRYQLFPTGAAVEVEPQPFPYL